MAGLLLPGWAFANRVVVVGGRWKEEEDGAGTAQ